MRIKNVHAVYTGGGIWLFYGEMTGDFASKNRETLFQEGVLYQVRGSWRHRTWGDNNDRHENVFYISDIQTL